jgi:hypothetical protein
MRNIISLIESLEDRLKKENLTDKYIKNMENDQDLRNKLYDYLTKLEGVVNNEITTNLYTNIINGRILDSKEYKRFETTDNETKFSKITSLNKSRIFDDKFQLLTIFNNNLYVCGSNLCKWQKIQDNVTDAVIHEGELFVINETTLFSSTTSVTLPVETDYTPYKVIYLENNEVAVNYVSLLGTNSHYKTKIFNTNDLSLVLSFNYYCFGLHGGGYGYLEADNFNQFNKKENGLIFFNNTIVVWEEDIHIITFDPTRKMRHVIPHTYHKVVKIDNDLFVVVQQNNTLQFLKIIDLELELISELMFPYAISDVIIKDNKTIVVITTNGDIYVSTNDDSQTFIVNQL